MQETKNRLFLFLLIFFFFGNAYAITKEQSAEKGKSAAKAGAAAAKGKSKSSANLFGAGVQGGTNDGSFISADFSLDSTAKIKCFDNYNNNRAVTAGGATLTCKRIIGNAPSFRLCEGKNGFPARNDCSNGILFEKTNVPPNVSLSFNTNTSAILTGCNDNTNECELKVHQKGSFEGGAAETEATANNKFAAEAGNSNTLTGSVMATGVVTKEGQTILPGTGTTTGAYKGALIANAGFITGCMDRTKQALDNGSAIFTCDQTSDVGALTQGSCTDTKTCVEWVSQTQNWTETCEASVTLDGTSCTKKIPTKICIISNVRQDFSCNVTKNITVKARLIYDRPKATCLTFIAQQAIAEGQRAPKNSDGLFAEASFLQNAINTFGGQSKAFPFVNDALRSWNNGIGRDGTNVSPWYSPQATNVGDKIEVCDKNVKVLACDPGFSTSASSCTENIDSAFPFWIFAGTKSAGSTALRPNQRWEFRYQVNPMTDGCTLYKNNQ